MSKILFFFKSAYNDSMYSNIIRAASAFPEQAYTNDQFIAKFNVDTTCEWIEQMTGIKQRYFVSDEKELEGLATIAASKVIDDVCVDGIIVATSSHAYRFPGLSHIVHKNLGLKKYSRAFDVSAACNGFMVALSIADSWIKHEGLKNVIVIGAEAMSSMLNMSDRASCCLFGDGAGAVLLGASSRCGIIASEHVVLSQGYEALTAKQFIVMNGRAVFENSIKTFEEIILNVLKKAVMTVDDVDLFILHQANYRIFQSLAKIMKLDEAKVPFLATYSANTSAATIPIALSQIDFKDKTMVLAGFGAGFTASASLISCK